MDVRKKFTVLETENIAVRLRGCVSGYWIFRAVRKFHFLGKNGLKKRCVVRGFLVGRLRFGYDFML